MLTWDFKKPIGRVDVTQKGNKATYNLYQGNAFMIMLWEDSKQYQLITFWADEKHAKNCLGLTKGYDNIYDGIYDEMTFHLDGNYDICYKIAALLKRARIRHTLTY